MGASIYAQIYNRKWQKGCKYVKNESEIMKPVEVGKDLVVWFWFFFSKPWKFCKMKIQILCSVSSRGYSSLSTVFSVYQTQRWMGKKALTFSNTTLEVCRLFELCHGMFSFVPKLLHFFVIWQDICFCDKGCYIENELIFNLLQCLQGVCLTPGIAQEGKSASRFPSSCTFILPFPVFAWTRIFEIYKSISFKALGTASDENPVYYIAVNLWQPCWFATSITSHLLFERNIHI